MDGQVDGWMDKILKAKISFWFRNFCMPLDYLPKNLVEIWSTVHSQIRPSRFFSFLFTIVLHICLEHSLPTVKRESPSPAFGTTEEGKGSGWLLATRRHFSHW